jgi:D-arginine utilization repressor
MARTLSPHRRLADAIAALFAPLAEVAVHDLDTDTLVYIANPMSPRRIGEPSNLRELGLPSRGGFIGPYEKTHWDGRRIKSISVVLAGKPAAMLCVNVDVSRFEAMRGVLDTLLGPATREAEAAAAPLLRHDWHETLNRFIALWLRKRKLEIRALDRNSRRDLVAAIFESGGFQGPRAASYVAGLLHVSRATIYNELASCRKSAIAA